MSVLLCFWSFLMREIKLHPRLSAVASFIPLDSRVADIGTDHGYLPIWLVQRSICKSAIACDLREGPLSQAKRFAAEYGVAESISFRLGDGLSPVLAQEIDTVVIAGMGGETIEKILTNAPWLGDGDYKLILQPQSKQPELIKWLYKLGYMITEAGLAEDDGRIYMAIAASRGQVPCPSESGLYVPGAIIDSGDPLMHRYVSGIIKKLEGVVSAISKSGRSEENQRVRDLTAAVKGLYDINRRAESEQYKCE